MRNKTQKTMHNYHEQEKQRVINMDTVIPVGAIKQFTGKIDL